MSPWILTLRSGEPAPGAVTALWKEEHLPRLEVQALSLGDTGHLLERVLGGRLDSGALGRLWRLTGGNVLFLRQVVEAGLSSGALQEREHVWAWDGGVPVSSELAEIVDAQMGELPDEVREVVDLLALGEPLAPGELASMVNREAVENAEDRGLIRVQPHAGGLVCRLAHPIYGEVRRARLGSLRSRRLRAGLVGAMAGLVDPHDVLRRAVLTLDSDITAEPAELLAAARLAIGLFDLELGERLAGASADAEGGAEALLTQAMALSWLSRGEEAESILCGLSFDVGDPLRAIAGYARVGNLFWTLRRPAQAEAVLATALSDQPTGPHRQLLVGMAVALDGSLGRAQQALDQGLDLLNQPAVPELAQLMAALGVTGAAAVLGRVLTAQRIAALGFEAADRAKAGGIPRFGLADLTVLALRLAGDLDGAKAVARQVRADSRDALGPARLMGLVVFGQAALGSGRVGPAERALTEAWAALRTSNHEFRFRCRVHLVEALAMSGRAAAAAELLGELETENHPAFTFLEPENRLARAWVRAAEGATTAAAAAAGEAAEMARSAGYPAYEVLALQWAASFGDPHGADRLTELANLVEGPRAPTAAALARAVASGDASALNEVSQRWERLGDILAAADAAACAARLFASSGLTGSAMVAAARAHQLAERCDGARTPTLVSMASPLPISAREREVVTLAGQGLTNREIADRLTLSTRTVEGHLYRVGKRLGISDRAKLIRLLHGD